MKRIRRVRRVCRRLRLGGNKQNGAIFKEALRHPLNMQSIHVAYEKQALSPDMKFKVKWEYNDDTIQLINLEKNQKEGVLEGVFENTHQGMHIHVHNT